MPGRTRPPSVADPVGQVAHLRNTACTSPTTSWPSTTQRLVLGHAQRHVQHGAVLGGVDVRAGEHGIAAGLDVRSPGEAQQGSVVSLTRCLE